MAFIALDKDVSGYFFFIFSTNICCGYLVELPHRSTSRLNTLKTGDPKTDQMLQNVASDQGLYCLQIVQPFFFRNVYIIWPDTPKIKNGLFQYSVGEFIQSLMG